MVTGVSLLRGDHLVCGRLNRTLSEYYSRGPLASTRYFLQATWGQTTPSLSGSISARKQTRRIDEPRVQRQHPPSSRPPQPLKTVSDIENKEKQEAEKETPLVKRERDRQRQRGVSFTQ